jgi:hypothetical protein
LYVGVFLSIRGGVHEKSKNPRNARNASLVVDHRPGADTDHDVMCLVMDGRSLQRLLLLLSAISLIIAGAPHADADKFTSGTEQAPLTPTLKTGDYVWKPAASPAGPVVIIVSIPEQTLYVYRNGVRIGRSTVSTGKSGHRTPTGVFTILQKNEKHTSSIYKGASMPYMQRLTWTGVALHAGNLPGYPASHGCVRRSTREWNDAERFKL